MAGLQCKIKIRSNQTMAGQNEVTTEVYDGLYMDRLDKRFLTYKRVTEDGECNALIRFGQEEMSITQQGSIQSKLEFIPGQRTFNDYHTPAGKLVLPIFTNSYSVDQSGDSINITLNYDIFSGKDALTTKMCISAKIC